VLVSALGDLLNLRLSGLFARDHQDAHASHPGFDPAPALNESPIAEQILEKIHLVVARFFGLDPAVSLHHSDCPL